MEGAQVAAGWYEDPQDASRLRYWDGRAWTEQVQAASADSAQAAAVESSDQQTDVHAEIEQLAAAKLSSRLGVKKELRRLPGLLGEHEQVVNLASGLYDEINGLVVATDRRVMFVAEGLVRSRLEDFPYERISSVQTEKGMLMGSLIIFASGNKAVIKNMAKDRASEIGDYVRGRISGSAPSVLPQQQPPAAAPPSAASDDVYEQLRKLGELRDGGVLTEEEFAEMKASLLARL